MTSCCPRHRMQWSGATGAIARCKNRSTGYARRCRSVHAWRWICGVKPKPKAGNKPSPHSIVHGLDKPGVFTTVSKTVEEFHTYITNNASLIPNYGERYRHGERISTGFVESTVNQVVSKRMVKKQQMQWSKRGAHLLLQIRTRVLNGEWEATFRTWYPGFRAHTQPLAA